MLKRNAAKVIYLAVLLWLGVAANGMAADYCGPYIQKYEKQFGIPNGLLRAIALTESGNRGVPWPYAINKGGAPFYPTTFEQAIKYMRNKDGSLAQNVAVGCMQIHMRYHGDVLPIDSIEWILHPAYNVRYAAYFLYQLRKKHGSWTQAVARYHAGPTNFTAQRDYVCAVWRNWQRVRRLPPSLQAKNYCGR